MSELRNSMRVKRDLYSDRYDTPWKLNTAGIWIYKSSRKNAKWEYIPFHGLLGRDKVDDDKIMEQLIDTLAKIVTISKKFGKHLEIGARVDVGKRMQYENANGDMYHGVDVRTITLERWTFHSLENVISYLLDIVMLVYPYNELSTQEVYKNPSVKYYINNFYHWEEK